MLSNVLTMMNKAYYYSTYEAGLESVIRYGMTTRKTSNFIIIKVIAFDLDSNEYYLPSLNPHIMRPTQKQTKQQIEDSHKP